MREISEIRPSPIAGRWYSGDPDRLRKDVDGYLSAAKLPELPGRLLAVIAPHAGHRYSGRTAGYAFAPLQGQERDLAAVISPMHDFHPASLLTSAHRAYATPMGRIAIDTQAVTRLDELLRLEAEKLTPISNDSEHSLEIELPFLQRALRGDFKLLPVMVRSQSPETARHLGHALAQVMKERSGVMVASTDLSHFKPADVTEQLDAEMLRRISKMDPDVLFEAEQTGKGFACGVAAVAAVVWAALEMGADRVEILHHSTSGDETGDMNSVVGYGAAAILKSV